MDIRQADLILVRGNGLIDHAIERISNSEYSHIAGIVKPNELIESQAFRREGYQALDKFDGYADVYTCDSLTDTQRQQIVSFVLSKLGTRYNYGIIGWEFLHYTTGIDLPIHDDETLSDCSQLWFDGYRDAGIDLCPGLTIVSPGDLAKSTLLRKIGSF